MSSFTEVKLFQVKPDKLSEFEEHISHIIPEQRKQPGCLTVRYMKRFYTLDGTGNPPRELTKIVKCVKYYAWWEFESKEDYGHANDWFFEKHEKDIQRLLIMPFDINCGYSLE